jgi:hypothetical protein
MEVFGLFALLYLTLDLAILMKIWEIDWLANQLKLGSRF